MYAVRNGREAFFLTASCMAKIIDYVKETRAELRHVTWPTRKQAIIYTAVVIGISLVTAAYLGVFDYLFSALLKLVI